jgi:GABA(A) receptor-associated protein
MYKFKNNKKFYQRLEESNRTKKKYPGKIPIIINKHKSSKLPNIEKYKFLVSEDLTVGQLLFIIKKHIKLKESIELFIYINESMPSISSSILEIYNKYKSNDGFLYIVYGEQNDSYSWMYTILKYLKIV